jgi:hypothetical protein
VRRSIYVSFVRRGEGVYAVVGRQGLLDAAHRNLYTVHQGVAPVAALPRRYRAEEQQAKRKVRAPRTHTPTHIRRAGCAKTHPTLPTKCNSHGKGSEEEESEEGQQAGLASTSSSCSDEETLRERLIQRIIAWSKMEDDSALLSEVRRFGARLEKTYTNSAKGS